MSMKQPPYNYENERQKAERIAYLIAGHLRGTLTPSEMDELDEWITASDENLELFERLTNEDNLETALHQYLHANASENDRTNPSTTKGTSTFRKVLLYLSAACLILLASGLVFFLVRKNQTDSTSSPFAISPSPGKELNKAVLTLSNGRIIILDSTASGLLANEGPVNINKEKAGEIFYQGTSNNLKYNTLTTPRGGQYKLILSDSTEVWLNAESSLKFPAGFAATHRIVELTGEAFFHVSPNAHWPFTVQATTPAGKTSSIRVLGTQFNVNSYGDENAIKTTLLQGSVQIEYKGQHQILTPGQQANSAEDIRVITGDLQGVTAWKENKFHFRNTSIRTIGEQIKRWYNVDIIYQGTNTPHLSLEISRDAPLQRLLQLLQSTREVRFTLKGKQLVIET